MCVPIQTDGMTLIRAFLRSSAASSRITLVCSIVMTTAATAVTSAATDTKASV